MHKAHFMQPGLSCQSFLC